MEKSNDTNQNQGAGTRTSKKFLLIALLLAVVVAIVWIKLRPGGSGENTAGDSSILAIDSVPDVQVFMPGFSVHELKLNLPNINALRYGADGKLYALAYDGHIYVLTDTDGDGLEDKAEIWWDKNLFVSPVAMAIAEEGIYVSSLNKLSLIQDLDRDGKAETEKIMATNWVKPDVYTGNSAGGVDALGVAKDKNGNVFYMLGAADFTNAYLVDSTGKAHYDINSQRGTVLKLAPGSKKPEIFCTGVRFLVAMAFNEEGDLFATDQEGATWLSNGNPYDELLHIEKGRHYGFPPRHPEYLPKVIDEPSVFDFRPQHQSATGLNFNLPVNGGPVFGPSYWKGDALVTGYSRGKVYRTKLVKTPSGYVAQNFIFASLSKLTVDACPSPDGAIVVSTHSGYPDWGQGPQAIGRLYKITYTNKNVPMPVSVWAATADQVKIAFDKPLKKEYLHDLAEKIKIEYGQYVETGDRFEVLRPGYRAVERQQAFPRRDLHVKSVELSTDGYILILNTNTQTEPVTYAVTLPAFSDDKKAPKSISQVPTIDISYKLNGVGVDWKSNTGNGQWNGYLPHLDLNVSMLQTEGITEINELRKFLKEPGQITFKTRLNLWHMLRPDKQPESELNYNLPPEDVNLILKSSGPLSIKAQDAIVSASTKKGAFYETRLLYKSTSEKAYPLEVSMETSGEEPHFEVFYTTAEDERPRALQNHRFFVPWLTEIFSNEVKRTTAIPELTGGNWERGKKLFFGQATCSSCHSFGGEGKDIGPDLSNLVFRDYQSVLRDIQDPSAAINPDFVGQIVNLKDDKTLIGMISYIKDSMVIRDITGQKTTVSQNDVKNTKAMATSLMPPGIDKALGPEKMKDLMTFLLTSLRPADYQHEIIFGSMRNKSEVNAVLNRSGSINSPESKSPKPLNILWVSGPKDHGPDEHNYPLQQQRWAELLSLADQVNVTKISEWPTQEAFDKSDVIVFFWDYPEFSEENGKQLDEYLARGGGLVYLHFAVDATEKPEALANRIGMAWRGGTSKFRHGEVALTFSDRNNPITRGFDKTTFVDESYWDLIKGNKEVNVLATVKEEDKDRPMIWTTTEGKGRVFVSILGHYDWTFDDPLFRILLLRGIAWAGAQDVNRLEEIATMGARVSN